MRKTRARLRSGESAAKTESETQASSRAVYRRREVRELIGRRQRGRLGHASPQACTARARRASELLIPVVSTARKQVSEPARYPLFCNIYIMNTSPGKTTSSFATSASRTFSPPAYAQPLSQQYRDGMRRHCPTMGPPGHHGAPVSPSCPASMCSEQRATRDVELDGASANGRSRKESSLPSTARDARREARKTRRASIAGRVCLRDRSTSPHHQH